MQNDDKGIPMSAHASWQIIQKIPEEISKNVAFKNLMSGGTDSFSHRTVLSTFKPAHNSLLEMVEKYSNCLNDIQLYLTIIISKKFATGGNFDAEQSFSNEIDGIMLKIREIPYALFSFGKEHKNILMMQPGYIENTKDADMDVSPIIGHRIWLREQITYLNRTARMVAVMYKTLCIE